MKRHSPNVAVRITPGTHARIVLVCEQLGISVNDWIERAAVASLQRQEESGKVKAYEATRQAYDMGKTSNVPYPDDFGLPRDFGNPKGM